MAATCREANVGDIVGRRGAVRTFVLLNDFFTVGRSVVWTAGFHLDAQVAPLDHENGWNPSNVDGVS